MIGMDSGFTAVWSRVTGVPPGEDELTALRRWLRDEAEGIRAYEALLRGRFPTAAERTLRALLQTERRHFCRLQVLYYLRTGDNWTPPPPGPQQGRSWMKALRERYAAAIAQEESYRRFAASEKRDLAALCAALAKEEEAQAALLRKLISRLFFFSAQI